MVKSHAGNNTPDNVVQLRGVIGEARETIKTLKARIFELQQKVAAVERTLAGETTQHQSALRATGDRNHSAGSSTT